MKALVFSLNWIKAGVLKVAGRIRKDFFYQGPLSMIDLADVPEPDLKGPDWVKLKVRMCGFCGSDLNLIMARESPMAVTLTSYPAIMGHEFCAEVVETGNDVSHCKTGDVVTVVPTLDCATRGVEPVCRPCRTGRNISCENVAKGSLAPGMFIGVCKDVGGGFAEYVAVHKSKVFHVPEGVSPESATLTEPLAVALQAVMDNLPIGNEKALVVGGGVIGLMIIKVLGALAPDCEITVVEPAPFAAEQARHAGAANVTGETIMSAAEKMTGAEAYRNFLGQRILLGGFERVYDAVGISSTVRGSLQALAAGGTMSLVGISDRLWFDPTPVWLKQQTIKGCYGYGYHDTPEGNMHTFEIALELMASGKVQVHDMLTHKFAIEDYKEMIAVNLAKGKHRAIKTAISFS